MSELAKKKCVPCEGGVKPYTPQEAQEMLKQVSKDWMLIDGAHLLIKELRFKDFAQALAFANKVGEIAEAEQHHPELSIGWGHVGVELTTHAIDGLSENDFILAAKIDMIGV
ncbi:MAG: 4a-hydroxytetrahydrobiopterin dehydratase [Candidatus Adlerbacteria bacterium]|nr:4a-hydroxytetrahydrobiopterin dehydratase [Candidatus Adlerbacteria bacterium]